MGMISLTLRGNRGLGNNFVENWTDRGSSGLANQVAMVARQWHGLSQNC